MKFYSTKDKKHIVNAKQAILTGLAPNNGLYMPLSIPKLSSQFFKNITSLSLNEIALEVSKLFLEDEINSKELEKIVNKAYDFKAPLKLLDRNLFCLELFHGPTFAFKDFAAHFMAQLIGYYRKDENQLLNILVATSGDTGGAVARGFYKVPGIRVVILYPKNKVSKLQEKQLTTLNENIVAIEIEGSFDDCQSLVKQAFLDEELNKEMLLTSANSINIARLIPQSFYYLSAYAQLLENGVKKEPTFVVPSGNLGNVCAGMIANKMGMPVENFVIAHNQNNAVTRYLETKEYEVRETIPTISNAMDVGSPNNFPRALELFDNSWDKISKKVFSASFSDNDTKKEIKRVFNKYDYVIDPHTAVGFLGLEEFKKVNSNCAGIVLGTAHAIKFMETMKEVLPKDSIKISSEVEKLMNREKIASQLSTKYSEFKEFLISNK